MKKDNRIWNFSYYFFIFLSIYVTIKFIFIFFFRSAYEPKFIFELTPFYMFSGFNNLQLLFLSFGVIITDTYLHFKKTKKHLFYSFFLTGMMLAGLAFSISYEELSTTIFDQYIIFGCLIIILLVDHNHFLRYKEDIIKYEQEKLKEVPSQDLKEIDHSIVPKPISVKRNPIFSMKNLQVIKPKRFEKRNINFFNSKTKNISNKSIKANLEENIENKIKLDINVCNVKLKREPPFRSETVTNDLQEKAKKLEKLEKEIQLRRMKLVEQEIKFNKEILSYANNNEDNKNKNESNPITKPKVLETEKKEDNHFSLLDELEESAAIIERGIVKQINDPFLKLFGYKSQDIIEKRLLNIIAPESLDKVKEHYLERLKGEKSSIYDANLVTKNNSKIHVMIRTKVININNKKAEVAIFSKI